MKDKTVRIQSLERFTGSRHHSGFDDSRFPDSYQSENLTEYVTVKAFWRCRSWNANKNNITLAKFLAIFWSIQTL
jgi:hypothetical protein